MDTSKNEAFVLSDSVHTECIVVSEFLDDIRIFLDKSLGRRSDRDEILIGYLLRVIGHLRSVKKLNHPGDFQTISFIDRAIFEIAVDLTLLIENKNNYSIQMILDWEQSAKLKYAENILAFIKANEIRNDRYKWTNLIPKDFEQIKLFIARFKQIVMENRTRKDKKHSLRWTGKDLSEDARQADKVASFNFEQFYVFRHSPLCWNLHGSGFAGVRNISEDIFPMISGISFNECAHLSLIIGKLLLREYKVMDYFIEKFNELDKKIVFTKVLVYKNYPEVYNKVFGKLLSIDKLNEIMNNLPK